MLTPHGVCSVAPHSVHRHRSVCGDPSLQSIDSPRWIDLRRATGTVEYSALLGEISDLDTAGPRRRAVERRAWRTAVAAPQAVPLLNGIRHGPHTNDGGNDDAFSLLRGYQRHPAARARPDE